MQNKKALILSLGLMLLLVLALAVGCQSKSEPTTTSGADNPIELRFTTVVSSLHPNFKSMERFAEEVSKKTNGKVKIVVYPSGTLAQPMESYNAVKNGISDMAAAPVGYSPAVMPLNKLFGDALMGASNATEAAKIWSQAFNNMPELQKELEGVHVLWLYATSPFSVATSNQKISKMEDFKGQILRFPPGLEPLGKAWGASPVNMAVGDIYVAMDKGAVHGYYGASELLQSMKLADHTKYITDMYMGYSLSYVGVNQKVWDSLPADVKKVFEELAPWGQEITIQAYDESDKQARDFAISKNCEVVKMEDAELQKVYSAAKQVFEKLAADLDAQGKSGKKVLSELEKITSQAK